MARLSTPAGDFSPPHKLVEPRGELRPAATEQRSNHPIAVGAFSSRRERHASERREIELASRKAPGRRTPASAPSRRASRRVSASTRLREGDPLVPGNNPMAPSRCRHRSAKPAHAPFAYRFSTKGRSQNRRLRSLWAKVVVVVAASGLVGTAALPAYASSTDGSATASPAGAAVQTLLSGGATVPAAARDAFSITENSVKLDSTVESTVSPTVQRLAQTLMVAVGQGRLTGYVPDHIPEIRNLAEGRAVPGCGVDYRVLQTIEVALANFTTVGVSDINRRCTGQIEGAGSASSHYANGGGHAVDFYLLNGRPLTGGDPGSLKLIRALDPLMPPKTDLGQVGCRGSVAVTNFLPFDDTCDHLHIDFRQAQGTTLKLST